MLLAERLPCKTALALAPTCKALAATALDESVWAHRLRVELGFTPFGVARWMDGGGTPVGGFRAEGGLGCYDFSFWLRLLRAGFYVHHLNEPIEMYLERPTSHGHRTHTPTAPHILPCTASLSPHLPEPTLPPWRYSTSPTAAMAW